MCVCFYVCFLVFMFDSNILCSNLRYGTYKLVTFTSPDSFLDSNIRIVIVPTSWSRIYCVLHSKAFRSACHSLRTLKILLILLLSSPHQHIFCLTKTTQHISVSFLSYSHLLFHIYWGSSRDLTWCFVGTRNRLLIKSLHWNHALLWLVW